MPQENDAETSFCTVYVGRFYSHVEKYSSSKFSKIMKILLSILLSYTLSEAATQHMNENVKYTIANAKNPEMEYSFRDSSSYFEVETTSLNTT